MRSAESRWKFSFAVLLPVAGAVIVTLGLAAGFILWSAQQTDDRSLARQRILAAKMIETAKDDFETSQRDQVLRYDAVDLFLAGKPAKDDIDDYFGEDEYDVYAHERVYVLDPELNAVYAAREGEATDADGYSADRAAIDPLAVRFRAPALQSQILAYEQGTADTPPQVSDFVTLGGRVAIASVLPIDCAVENQWIDHIPGAEEYRAINLGPGSGVATLGRFSHRPLDGGFVELTALQRPTQAQELRDAESSGETVVFQELWHAG